MPLTSGQSLSFYEVLGPLGAGGMGEVYLARDTRLDREVAIKVLPEELADDEERLRRFEREAKTLASLNHPNVAGIHGIDQVQDTCFLAMELVPGADLEERLRSGALPVAEALDVCRQIAGGLEAAHEAGVVHRDLKPANVRITPEGVVKILDFGLAKPVGPNAPGSGTSSAQSDSFLATAEGMILGTPTYMSPEQARGKPVDRRTDIWAFGCVLYECLTGKRAFEGDAFGDLIAAILEHEPDLGALPPRTPARVRRLIERCLIKDPARRIRDIGDVGLELDEVLSGDPTGSTQEEDARRPGSLLRLAGAAVMGVALGALLWNAIGSPSSDETRDPQRMQLAIQLARHQELLTGSTLLAFAPDGNSLVFAGVENGRRMLLRRDLDDPRAIPIAGTENGWGPFFSPDGRWIGYATTDGALMRVPVEGGRPFQVGETRGAGGAAWMNENTIVFAPIYSDGLFRVSAEGGSTERLTTPDRAGGELGHWWPKPLPGGRYILFTGFRTPVDRSRVGVLDLETGETRWIVDGGFYGQFVASGHLLYVKGARLYAQPFDPETATATGAAVAVLDDLMVTQPNATAMLSVSSRGTLAYVTASLGDPPRELIWMDRAGIASPAMAELHRYRSVSLSPDDQQAALAIKNESLDLWTCSFERGTLSRLTSGADTERDAVWSCDGREVFYVFDRPPYELHRIRVGDPDSGRPIWDERSELDSFHVTVSPDCRTIGFGTTEEQTGNNIYTRVLDGSEPQRTIRDGHGEETFPSFSPDGNWIVYQSTETGRPEIYVEALPGPGQRVQVTADGGNEPLWARNGEIFYRHDDELHVVSTRLGESFEFDPPRLLCSFPVATSTLSRSFDVTADGTRILTVMTPPESRPRQIEIVPGWTEELERLLSE